MTPGAAPVMADVARLAGVSHQTVSRVVNASPKVSAATRSRVLAAMDELGYRPNATARALARRHTGIIGVIAFETGKFGPTRTVTAVEHAARAVGLGLTVTRAPDDSPDEVTRALHRLRDLAAEGVVVVASHGTTIGTVAASPAALPCVHIGDAVPGIEVGIDGFGGASAATQHLLGLGHRTVHHVAGPEGWIAADNRLAGWAAALADAQRPVVAPSAGDWGAASGHAAMADLLERDPSLTAVFVANDQMALGALRAIQDSGRRVPADVSVVGFDDQPEAPYFGPALTTLAPPFAAAGRHAVRLLAARMSDGDPGSVVVDTGLVLRCSTGPPPAG